MISLVVAHFGDQRELVTLDQDYSSDGQKQPIGNVLRLKPRKKNYFFETDNKITAL